MEINISNGFDLGGFGYIIDTSEEAKYELTAKDCWGDHTPQYSRIRLLYDLPQDQFRNTFFHELMEAINEVSLAGNLKHPDINNIANGLAQIFKDYGVNFVCKPH